MPVITGATAYPDDPLASLAPYRVESADALGIAVECGSQKALNLVLLLGSLWYTRHKLVQSSSRT